MQPQELEIGNKILKVWKGDYVRLEGIETNAATPSTTTYENVKKNCVLGLLRLEQLPEYQKVKGHDYPIALVGGAPSLKKYIHELKGFRTILACGSSHDHLISQGVIPTYAAICDPDPISMNYYKKLHPEVKYLLSTGCDATLVDYFKDYQRVMWHCHSQDYEGKTEEIEKLQGSQYHAISGGCTVGLRSINIAIMMGYTNIHFFGFDSCMTEEEGHAYEVSEKEKTDFGRTYNLRLKEFDVDAPSEKVYKCVGYQLAQAYAFKDFYIHFGRLFTPTFHCDGLLPDLYKLMLHTLNGQGSINKETNDAIQERLTEGVI